MPIQINTFDDAEIAANPNNHSVLKLENSHDGSYLGHIVAPVACNNPAHNNPRICVNGDPTGLAIDYIYDTPIASISNLRFHNNGGADLNDSDGFGQFDYEIFDSLNVAIGSGTMTLGNGGAPFTHSVGLIQDVKRIQIRNMTQLPGGADTNGSWWREFETVTPGVDCAAATNITPTSATMRATGLSVPAGNFYEIRWGTASGGPYPSSSGLIPSGGISPEPVSFPTGNTLAPNTTYYYEVCLYDGDAFGDDPQPNAQEYNVFPICSGECSFTTLDAEVYCGMLFDPDTCTLVDPGNGEPYSYCLQF